MKLLLLSEMFPSIGSPTAGTFVAGQAAQLARRLDITVAIPVVQPLSPRHWRERSRLSDLSVPSDAGISPERVLYLRYPGLPWRLDTFNVHLAYHAVRRAIRRHGLKPDIIHCHPGYPTGYTGYLVARWLRVPLVMTLHGFDMNVFGGADIKPYSNDPSFASMFYSPTTRARLQRALLHSARVVTVSQELADKAEALGVSRQRLNVIRNGIDASQFYPRDKRLMRRQLGLPEDASLILFVGSLSYRKDPLGLLKAVRLLHHQGQKVFCVFLGQGELRKALESAVVEAGLEHYVRILGSIRYAEIPLWMAACDALILPTFYESFGMVLMEALACGRPVVTTLTGAIPELLRDGEHGALIPPGDPDSLAQAISRTLEKAWDQDALVRYTRSFTWERIATELERLYSDVLAERLQRLAAEACDSGPGRG